MGGIAGAQVEHGTPRYGQRVIAIDVLLRCRRRICRQGHAGHGGCIPLDAQLGLQLGHARGLLALVGTAHRLAQDRVDIRHAAHQAHVAQGRAKAPVDAAVTLFAAKGKDIADRIDIAAGTLDFIHADRMRELAQVHLDTQFRLLRLVWRKDLARIGRRQRRRGALAQAFDVIAVQRDRLAGLDQQRDGGRGGAFIVARGARAVLMLKLSLSTSWRRKPTVSCTVSCAKDRVSTGRHWPGAIPPWKFAAPRSASPGPRRDCRYS